jgi:hypothetical protein
MMAGLACALAVAALLAGLALHEPLVALLLLISTGGATFEAVFFWVTRNGRPSQRQALAGAF